MTVCVEKGRVRIKLRLPLRFVLFVVQKKFAHREKGDAEFISLSRAQKEEVLARLRGAKEVFGRLTLFEYCGKRERVRIVL